MSRCRASCVSSRVLAGRTIDLLVPWLTAIVALAYGAVLLPAPGHGAGAGPSPDGSQVIWSSNWGQAGGPVADYVARVSWATAARK